MEGLAVCFRSELVDVVVLVMTSPGSRARQPHHSLKT
jgi:hypothetical protein